MKKSSRTNNHSNTVVQKRGLKRLLKKKEVRSTAKAKTELDYTINIVSSYIVERAKSHAKAAGRKLITDTDIQNAKREMLEGKFMK